MRGRKTINVSVAAQDGRLSVAVKDDGVGFDPASVRGRGLGLIGMQERVMELGGGTETRLLSRARARRYSRRSRSMRRRPTMAIRILLADDHGVVRKGVRFLLERQPGMEVVGEAADGREAVRLAETANPDVVIMDIAMPSAQRDRGDGANGQARPEDRGDHPEHALR